VPRDDIEPGLYFKSPYYMEPEELGKSLPPAAQGARGDRAHAIAKIALRDRETWPPCTRTAMES